MDSTKLDLMELLKNLFEFIIVLHVFFEMILMEICYGDEDEIYDDWNESDDDLFYRNLSVCRDSYIDFPLKKYKEIIYFKNK